MNDDRDAVSQFDITIEKAWCLGLWLECEEGKVGGAEGELYT